MTSGIACALEGFVLNCGLLLAIGGQTSFVLRQGAVGRHVAWVVLICSLCDVVLIGVGTLGTGGHPLGPGQARALALAGAAFMIAYGTRSMLSGGFQHRIDCLYAPTVGRCMGRVDGAAVQGLRG
jgi:L-lysine exporter family protein LysE/ArgO